MTRLDVRFCIHPVHPVKTSSCLNIHSRFALSHWGTLHSQYEECSVTSWNSDSPPARQGSSRIPSFDEAPVPANLQLMSDASSGQ